MIDATEVDTLGPDVLAIASRAAVRGAATSARYTELVGLDELTRRQVLTEGGMSLGHVVGVEFDEETFQLTGLEIGAGLFKKPTVIPFEQVLTVGADVVVVRDEVASDDPAADASAGSAAVGRPAPVEGVAFREETFDVPLRAEELIVEKQVRVAEEIEISKEAFERTVSTAGSVRREQVHLTERAIVETPDAAETPSADEAAEGEHRES